MWVVAGWYGGLLHVVFAENQPMPSFNPFIPSTSILLPSLTTCRTLIPHQTQHLSASANSLCWERSSRRTHLVECSHGLVGAADLNLIEEGGGAGAVFAGALG